MHTYFDKNTGVRLGVTGLASSAQWPGHIAVEGFWNEEFMYDLTTKEVVSDPNFVAPSPGITAEELADHLVTKGTITRAEVNVIKAAK